MKKVLLLLLALCLVIPVIALTACGDEETPAPTPKPAPHEHSFWDEWSSDEEKHWKDASCGHDDVRKDEAAHVDADLDDKCDVCAYELPPHAIEYAEEYTVTEDGHYKATVCCQNHEVKIEPHVDKDTNGLCDVCGHGEEIIEKVYKTVTLKANVNGQLREVEEIEVEVDTKLTAEQVAAIIDATYRGRGFAAWYLDEAFENKFDFEAVISDNIIIYGDVGNLAGKEIDWSYDEATKTLTLTGKGEMFDFTNATVLPWYGLAVTNASIDPEITSIGGYTFYASESSMLPTIALHEGITKIGAYAFYGQTALTEVVLPDSLVVIANDAFRACKGLTYIDVGGENLETVDVGAFGECSGAKYVIFNDAIDNSAQVFEGCSAVTHMYFAGNKGQFESITIGFGSPCFETAYMFYYTSYEPVKAGPYWYRTDDGKPAQWCYSINYLPASNVKIAFARDYVFVKNPVISQDNVDFRDNLWYNGYQFDTWTGTTTFQLGAKLTGDITYTGSRGYKVGDGVDYNISGNTLTISGSGKMWDFGSVIAAPYANSTAGITEIVIGSNVTYIGDYAFCDFPDLESIEIKSNIVEMSTKAFFGCQNLKYVYYYGNELEAMNCKGLKNQEEAPNLTVYCQELEGEAVSYLTAKGIVPTISYWKDVVVVPAVIDPTTGEVKEEAKTTRLTWEFEDGVLTVGGEGAIIDYLDAASTPWGQTFYYIDLEEDLDFDSLEESVEAIVIRDGITSIGNNAFYGLYNAETITISDGVKRISSTSFGDTGLLNSEDSYNEQGLLIVGKQLIKVDPDKAGTRVLIPSEIVGIAEGAFEDCADVTAIRVPNMLAGATALSYAGLDSLDTVFVHTTEASWNNNPTKDALPADATLYFFSARMPTTVGNYWYNLNDPHIWEYWTEQDGTAAVGDTTVTVTAEEIANGAVNYALTAEAAGEYTIAVEGATVEIYQIGGSRIYNKSGEPTTFNLEAGEYAIIVYTTDLAAGDYTIAIGYTAPAVDETPAA